MLLLVPSVALGGVLEVPDDYPTIQQALDVANTGDVVVVAAGTYVEPLQLTGDRSITLEGSGAVLQPPESGGTTLSVVSADLTVRGVIFDGRSRGRGIVMTSGASVTVEGCRFERGLGVTGGGGAISSGTLGASLVVRDSTFFDNRSVRGAHLNFVNGERLTIERSVFEDGVANENGGAVRAANAEVVIDQAVFLRNAADDDDPKDARLARGGALYLSNTTGSQISRSLFCGNQATEAAGAVAVAGSSSEVTLVGNLFAHNTTPGFGGALWANAGIVHTFNNHFVANGSGGAGSAMRAATPGDHVNDLFAFNDGPAGTYAFFDDGSETDRIRHALFFGNEGGDSNVAVQVAVLSDPGLRVVPSAVVCEPGDWVPALYGPVRDAGDGALGDLDGSPSDLGAFGGPEPYELDEDDDGVLAGVDCDDRDAAVGLPGTETAADGVDSDCDGFELCFEDLDEDGVGGDTTVLSATLDCSEPGVAPVVGDCDDADPARSPSAVEVSCNEVDDDCNPATPDCDEVVNRIDTPPSADGCACDARGGAPWLGWVLFVLAVRLRSRP
ncbi:MAG: right-handed parallel beta-helix repeat-containing protein [Myxococcales bacterium]|nr:right-handed parallel beta-helix repeat-containing protein [Myxococcales bacterium]